MGKFMAHATHGREDPERATLPFIAANVAASADQEAIVLLTIEGVWLATKGYADDVHHEGMPPLREVLDSLVATAVSPPVPSPAGGATHPSSRPQHPPPARMLSRRASRGPCGLRATCSTRRLSARKGPRTPGNHAQ